VLPKTEHTALSEVFCYRVSDSFRSPRLYFFLHSNTTCGLSGLYFQQCNVANTEYPFFSCPFIGNVLFCKVQNIASYFMLYICAVGYFYLSDEPCMYRYFLVNLSI